MSSKSRKQVLVTRVDEPIFREISGLLRQAKMDVHRATWDDTTLDLVQTTSFDAIIIGFPVSDAALSQFLATARSEGSACSRAGLVLVSDPDHEEQAHDMIGRGANRVVAANDLTGGIVDAVEDLARSAPRLSVRAPARIKLFSDGRPLRVMAQIENLSTSGMLLRGVTQFPVGTAFDFEITVPGESAAIQGTAEITRATDPDQEAVEGVGVRFVSFTGSDKVRLEMYLGRALH
jgi:DNA-binding NarL/FixJ family response regulator